MSETIGYHPPGPLPSGGLERTVRYWIDGIDAVAQGQVESFVPATDLGETHQNKGVFVTSENAALVKKNILDKFRSVVPDLLASSPDETARHH